MFLIQIASSHTIDALWYIIKQYNHSMQALLYMVSWYACGFREEWVNSTTSIVASLPVPGKLLENNIQFKFD